MENSRLESVKNLLRDKALTHLLISDLKDVEYLSGFRSSNALILISQKKNLLFSDFRYKEALQSFCRKNSLWEFQIIKESLFESVCSFLPQGSVCGFQANDLTVEKYDNLTASGKNIRFVKLSSEISELFLQKTPSEIAFIRKAARIGDSAFVTLLDRISEGMTEIALARELECLCSEYGSEKPSFDTIVLFGSRTAHPHGKPGNKRLKKGDFILIDFGCTVNGFCSDMTRTLVFGKASSRQRQIYDIVLNAQKKACNAAKADISSKELDNVARQFISAEGFGEEFGHALGHGVGLRIHESPRISFNSDSLIKKNMIITIEPGIYISNFGGVRIEDMVLIKENKAGLLTSAPKELIEL